MPFTPDNEFAGINGMDESYQVGTEQFPVVGHHAIMWHGTAGSAIDLNPPGNLSDSGAGAVRCGIQIGGYHDYVTGLDHAGMWRGTPESFVDLRPPTAYYGGPRCTDGVRQGGLIQWTSTSPLDAAIWSGTPESIVDLGPPGSQINGMAQNIQAGFINAVGGAHAGIWFGVPGSFTDLNPPGMTGGTHFNATTGRIHAGNMPQGGLVRAAVNFGTPTSWVGLQQFLPPGWGFSDATSICQDGDTIYVGGWAENPNTGNDNAILWIGTVSCWANCDGSTGSPALTLADFSCFLQRFVNGDGYANCDHSTTPPVLNVADFTCFLQKFALGCP